jgi:tRNA nucleotidyltransferase (CCA-adding enzyme)
MQKILDSVLERIKPSLTERKHIEKRTDIFVKKLQAQLTNAEVFIGGSYAKGTYLRNVKDIDIFVCFDPKIYSESDLSETLGKTIHALFTDVEHLHGSRDYFRVYIDSIVFEVIPILKISSTKEAKNITDISPFHVAWVKSQKDNTDEIRLAKSFCKAQGLYGAESYIKGFSGYALEILTIYYDGFKNLLKSVSTWKKPVIIDPEKHHKNIRYEVNPSKMVSPLILIDPVESGRNATASLSDEKFLLFIDTAQRFLKKPSEDFFIRKEHSYDSLSNAVKDNESLFFFELKHAKGKEDVIGCKILKVFEHMKKFYVIHGFDIIDCGWYWDKVSFAFLWFIIRKETLSKTFIHKGPPVSVKINYAAFVKKHPDAFEKDGNSFAEIERQFRTPYDISKWFMEDPYILERVEHLKLK